MSLLKRYITFTENNALWGELTGDSDEVLRESEAILLADAESRIIRSVSNEDSFARTLAQYEGVIAQ